MSNFLEDSLRALRDARDRLGSIQKISDLTGVPGPTMSRWLSGERKPKMDDIGVVFDKLGISISNGENASDLELIPVCSALPGAGSSLVTTSDVSGLVGFHRRFLQQIGIPRNAGTMFRVMGVSMEPTLHDGDYILADTTDTTLRDGKIYLVGLDGEFLVKSVQRTIDGWALVSSNPQYSPIRVTEADAGKFRVFGRVRWVSHVF